MKASLLIFILLTLISCTQPKEITFERLAEEWKVVDFEVTSKSLPQKVIKEIRKNTISTIYDFGKDSTLMIAKLGEPPLFLSWYVSGRNKVTIIGANKNREDISASFKGRYLNLTYSYPERSEIQEVKLERTGM
jgi:inosine/xanthosine triphosphate pyrophosphatase family protein